MILKYVCVIGISSSFCTQIFFPFAECVCGEMKRLVYSTHEVAPHENE